MSDTQKIIKDNFQENLKATEYLTEMGSLWKIKPEALRFLMKFVHDAFYSGQFKGTKLLEVGSGATVHSIAAASAFFPNIVLSDYVEDNVNQLKRYLNGDLKLKQFLEVPSGLEGYGYDIDEGIRMLEARIRKCVKRATRCDFLTEGVLLDEANSPETAPPFDVVMANLCLEVAPKDFTGFVNNLKRISKLVRPGGGLLITGFLQGGTWNVGPHVFHHIQIDEKDVVDALVQADFGNIHMKTLKNENVDDTRMKFKYSKLYCVTATKL